MSSVAVPQTVRELPLGERIRWARKKAGLSHDSLNKRIGRRDRSYLIRVEKGAIKRPGVELRDQIADVCGVPRDLFTDEDEEEAASMSIDDLLRQRVQTFMRAELKRFYDEQKAQAGPPA